MRATKDLVELFGEPDPNLAELARVQRERDRLRNLVLTAADMLALSGHDDRARELRAELGTEGFTS